MATATMFVKSIGSLDMLVFPANKKSIALSTIVEVELLTTQEMPVIVISRTVGHPMWFIAESPSLSEKDRERYNVESSEWFEWVLENFTGTSTLF